MIVCPNCNHQNPDGAVQCEACYTPMPTVTSCPNCGASVQSDAVFCGQCGFNLKAPVAAEGDSTEPPESPPPAATDPVNVPEIPLPEPLVEPDPLAGGEPLVSSLETTPARTHGSSAPESLAIHENAPSGLGNSEISVSSPAVSRPSEGNQTQLQQQVVKLLHVQTNRAIELPQGFSVIHIGKPNDRIPPDIDVAGFPDSDIVSRIHADIRVEGDLYYIEDVGSSNGTYINNVSLPVGNRHRLRTGDRIALGKGDKVTFLFQLS